MAKKGAALLHPIRHQIVKAIEAGVWVPGSKLPSTREMAKEMSADPRDIAAAYRALAAEGLVDLRPRSGAYVASVVGKGSAPAGLGEGWLAEILVDAVSREIPAMDLGDWIQRAVATLRLRVFVIAPIRDQVAGLCGELRRLYGLDATGATPEELEAGDGLPAELRRSDFLVNTESVETSAQRYASEAGLQSISITVRPDLMNETWLRLLRERPIYVVMTDARFEGLVANFLSGFEDAGKARPLVIGRDDLDAIPENAVVYVTQGARESLGPRKLNGHVLPPARFLSREASREIIDFIVHENLAALRGRHSEKTG